MRSLKRYLALVCCCMLFMTTLPGMASGEAIAGAQLTQASQARSGMVRVLLSSMGTVTALNVTVDGSYTADGTQNVTLSRGEKAAVRVDQTTGRITMTAGGQTFDMGQELNLRRHAAAGANGLRIAEAKKPANLYPGDLRLTAVSTGSGYKLQPILHVYMEYYLSGVVPYEMGNSAGLEALKAQAVAARTYTLGKMNQRSGSAYDVVDTTSDQVYYGNSDSTANCTNAVNATKGIVVMNGSSLTSTYYTASNGGQTEAAQNVWGGAFSYLTIKDDPFDKMNAASQVKRTTVMRDNTSAAQHSGLKALLQKKAEAALAAQGLSTADTKVLTIHAITPHTPKYAAPSRLFTKLDFDVIVSTRGGERALTLTCDVFSELESLLGMSINTMKNELWTVEENSGGFVLYARRFGHGVGMSQRGAMQMSAMGYTYDQILGFYYPGCRRVQYTFTHTILGGVADAPSAVIVTTEEPAPITEGAGMAVVRLAGSEDRMAIRKEASATGAVLTGVVSGGVVTVLRIEGEWALVRLGEVVGYAPRAALEVTGEAPLQSDATPTDVNRWATVVCSGTLNLRTSPSMDGGVRMAIPAGSVLCVFGVTGAWAYVQYGALTGYAATDFLQFSDEYPRQVVTGEAVQAGVTTPSGQGTVNLRAAASTGAKVLAEVPHGANVTLLQSDGTWCRVAYHGVEGYMMASFLVRYDQIQDAENAPIGDDAPEYGEAEPPVEPPEPDHQLMEAIVRTAEPSLILRSAPDEGSEAMTQLPRGSSVAVMEEGETWCLVRYGSLSGYVPTDLLYFPEDEADEIANELATVVTEGGSLNLRSQAKTGSDIVTVIPNGAQVIVLGAGTAWTRVSYRGEVGYVMTAYLAVHAPVADVQEEAAAETVLDYATVTTPSGPLNLRSAPERNAKILVTVPKNTRIPVLAYAGDWCLTAYQGSQGYVMRAFLVEDAAPAFAEDVHDHLAAADPEETAVPTAAPSPTAGPAATAMPEQVYDHRNEDESQVMPEDVHDHQAVSEDAYDHQVTPTQKPAPQPVYDPTLLADEDEWIGIVTVGEGNLNVRAWCAADAPVLTVIANGQTVEVLARGQEWVKIKVEGREGYCVTRFMTLRPGS